MKKLFIFPAFLLLISSGVTSNAPIRVKPSIEPVSVPLNTKLDSVNIKLMKLNKLTQE